MNMIGPIHAIPPELLMQSYDSLLSANPSSSLPSSQSRQFSELLLQEVFLKQVFPDEGGASFLSDDSTDLLMNSAVDTAMINQMARIMLAKTLAEDDIFGLGQLKTMNNR